MVKPSGRVVGVDLLPVRPPKGVSAIQGDFLSEEVQREVRRFVGDEGMGRPKGLDGVYLDGERDALTEVEEGLEEEEGNRCVDVVLSDMCEPWDMVEGLHKKTLSNPYYRMMNTSGNSFKDHVGSMVSFAFVIHCLRILFSSMLTSIRTGPLSGGLGFCL
jgi:21S rRNA (uridine2791-2'-O)-methyltransferase